jgi:Zn-dependent peptidase ImmA (M78 family)
MKDNFTCIRATPRSRENLRLLASSIREKFGISDDQPFPIVEFLELVLPALFENYSFEVASKEEMGSKHGETIPGSNTIRIREDIYLGACEGKGRDRLTLAHELGHLLLHASGISYIFDTDVDGPAYVSPEWQATAFGGELLMPYQKIVYMTPESISSRYWVSLAAACTQLRSATRRVSA